MQFSIPGYGSFSVGLPASGLVAPGRVFFLNDQATLSADTNAAAARNHTTPAKTGAACALFCTANNGDVIVVGPNHSQSIATLLGLTLPAGTVVIHTGLGVSWAARAFGGAAGSLVGGAKETYTIKRATGALAQSGVLNIFTVAGGPVWLKAIYGIVTTVIQTQLDNLKLSAVATGLTAVDLCSVLNITALAVGTLLSITGTFATALVSSPNQVAVAQASPTLVGPGVIRMDASASNTGQVQWYCVYEPAAPGAYMVAV